MKRFPVPGPIEFGEFSVKQWGGKRGQCVDKLKGSVPPYGPTPCLQNNISVGEWYGQSTLWPTGHLNIDEPPVCNISFTPDKCVNLKTQSIFWSSNCGKPLLCGASIGQENTYTGATDTNADLSSSWYQCFRQQEASALSFCGASRSQGISTASIDLILCILYSIIAKDFCMNRVLQIVGSRRVALLWGFVKPGKEQN